jgi:uncharacterized protein
MNVVERNKMYLKGILQGEGIFPHLEAAPASGFFNWDFGLAELPREPGIIVIRGPRQYGKSTWLEYQLRETLLQFGPGTALFLNGDYIAGPNELERDIESLMSYFPKEASVRRLFIDEITAVAGWQKAIKRLADRGVLRKVLLITTGSKASDIQREAELLPGRKGKLARTIYLFAQLPYKIFYDKAFPTLRAQTLAAYLIAGGSPLACAKEGHPSPSQSLFWRSEKHEIDFVRQGKPWIEVKAGHASPFEFDWFIRTFSREKLLVISSDRFDGSAVRGATLEDLLLDDSF